MRSQWRRDRRRHGRSVRSYGKYCAKIERMCFPGGASDGSVGVCMKHSSMGSRDVPALARRRTLVAKRRSTGRRGSSRGDAAARLCRAHAKSGSSPSARLILSDMPLERQASARACSAGGTSPAASSRKKSVFGSALTRIAPAVIAVPSRNSMRAARPSRKPIARRRRRCAASRRRRVRPRPPLAKSHPCRRARSPRALHAERAPGVVVRENVRRTGVARTGAGADEAVRCERRLQHRRVHVVLYEFRDRPTALRA